MTKAQAWERFGERLWYIWKRCDEYRCGDYWHIECGDFKGRGPTPEAAIADAFGETLDEPFTCTTT